MKQSSEPEPMPFRRFTDFAQRIVAVPKSEVEEKLAAQRALKKAKKHTARSA